MAITIFCNFLNKAPLAAASLLVLEVLTLLSSLLILFLSLVATEPTIPVISEVQLFHSLNLH